MMTRDEALLFGGILTSLKKRLEAAKDDWRSGTYARSHHEGRIHELTAVITELENQYGEDLEHLND